MKILFWNLKNNSNEKWIAKAIQENEIDIALFAEYHNTSFERIISSLESSYTQHDGYGGCEKITLLCKQAVSTIVKREQNRYTLYSCTTEESSYNIIGVHLPSKPLSDSDDRKNVIRDIVTDICEQERVLNNRHTIVIGDFNCNPFDEEMIQKDSFNAVLFKPIINYQDIIEYNSKRFRRFYNPIIHYLSETTQTYGSFYYSSGNKALYWNSFDQVLVRKELIDSIYSLEYLNTINGKKLIKDVKPNASISDHLPLIVCFMKG